MTSMAAINYNNCPMEGSYKLRLKKILDLPPGAEINMVSGCSIRDKRGIYEPQF